MLQRGFAGGIGPPISNGGNGRAGRNHNDAPRIGHAQQRVTTANKAVVSGEVNGHHIFEFARGGMRHWRERTECSSITNQNIKLAKPLINLPTQRVDHIHLPHIERHQRGAATKGTNRVVGFFQPAHCAGGNNHMRAFCGEAFGNGRTNAA